MLRARLEKIKWAVGRGPDERRESVVMAEEPGEGRKN